MVASHLCSWRREQGIPRIVQLLLGGGADVNKARTEDG